MSLIGSSTAGWYYEAPDPSVGIFTGGWIHEECPQDEPTTTDEIVREKVIQEWNDTDAAAEGGPWQEVEFLHKLTCSCGAIATVTDRDIR